MTVWFYTSTDGESPNPIGIWSANSAFFFTIFNRVSYYFRHFEVDYQLECFNEDFVEQGLCESELNLNKVSKEAFNVFHLRCQEALNNFPGFWNTAGDEAVIISEWEGIIKLLEDDIRYDPEWIRDYQLEMIRKHCIP